MRQLGQAGGRVKRRHLHQGLAAVLLGGLTLALASCGGMPDGYSGKPGVGANPAAYLDVPLRQQALLEPSDPLFLVQATDSNSEFSDLDSQDGDFSDLDGAATEERGYNDPLETLNRFTFAFNEMLDVMVIRPVAVTYRDWVPPPIKDSLRAFLRNLATPVILMNDLLQGEFDRAQVTFARFLINTSLSLGVADIAAEAGLPFHDEDFGQTLASYGVGEGFYLVLPILGPSNARDATGRLVDWLADPLTYPFEDRYGLPRAALRGIDFRSRNIETFDEIQRDSVDFYARIRSLYRQIRESEVRNKEGFSGNPEISERLPIVDVPLAQAN